MRGPTAAPHAAVNNWRGCCAAPCCRAHTGSHSCTACGCCLHCRAAQPRLDFSYFEYPDLATFEPTVTALLRFARAYRDRTGFAPGAFALYFVRRSGRRTNAQLNYGGDAGAPLLLPMHAALARILLSRSSTTKNAAGAL